MNLLVKFYEDPFTKSKVIVWKQNVSSDDDDDDDMIVLYDFLLSYKNLDVDNLYKSCFVSQKKVMKKKRLICFK